MLATWGLCGNQAPDKDISHGKAPVKAPFSNPNISASINSLGIAAQFRATKLPFRLLSSWIASATSSFPDPVGPFIMMTGFFLALSFAALTSMISTVELCVRNFVDHGYNREKSVAITGAAIFLFGLPSAFVWIKLDSAGVAFPEFLEVQDHIWGYGLMFSGLFIAFSIWKYGYIRWKAQVAAGEAPGGLKGYLGVGVSAFRDDFINTGDNDIVVGRWWDILLYIAFPILFAILMLSYFGDMIANTEDVWNPGNPKGLGIILMFWGVVAALFIFLNKYLIQRPIYRNIPDGAEVDISTLPGGDDELIGAVGEVIPGFEHQTPETSVEPAIEAELA